MLGPGDDIHRLLYQQHLEQGPVRPSGPLVAPPHAGLPGGVCPHCGGGGAGPEQKYQPPSIPPPNLGIGAHAMGVMGQSRVVGMPTDLEGGFAVVEPVGAPRVPLPGDGFVPGEESVPGTSGFGVGVRLQPNGWEQPHLPEPKEPKFPEDDGPLEDEDLPAIPGQDGVPPPPARIPLAPPTDPMLADPELQRELSEEFASSGGEMVDELRRMAAGLDQVTCDRSKQRQRRARPNGRLVHVANVVTIKYQYGFSYREVEDAMESVNPLPSKRKRLGWVKVWKRLDTEYARHVADVYWRWCYGPPPCPLPSPWRLERRIWTSFRKTEIDWFYDEYVTAINLDDLPTDEDAKGKAWAWIGLLIRTGQMPKGSNRVETRVEVSVEEH